jgi:phosphoribosylformylglycinamidine synthase subunit PurL
MAQLVESIEGLAEACAFFEVPVTGGNVSLYNETLGTPIFPTPVIGIVGLLDTRPPVPVGFPREGLSLVLLGVVGACDDVRFGGTQYVKQVLNDLWGLPPALDMEFEKRVQAAVRHIVREGLAESAHDLADGGLAVVGANVSLDSGLRPEFLLFGEAPSRILVSTADPARIQSIGESYGVPAVVVGGTMGDRLIVTNRSLPLIDTDVKALTRIWSGALEEKLESRR